MSTNEKWHVDPHLPTLVIDSEGREVASAYIGLPVSLDLTDRGHVAKAEARARLIAQAPAMAEALLMIAEYEADGPIDEWVEAASYSACQKIARAILSRLEAKP